MTDYYHGQDLEPMKCPVCDIPVELTDDGIVENERKSHYRCSFCGREFDLRMAAIPFFVPWSPP